MTPSPLALAAIEQLLTTSAILKAQDITFEGVNTSNPKPEETQTWQLTLAGRSYQVTFYPSTFDEKPSLRLLTFGEPLFEQLLGYIRNRKAQVLSFERDSIHPVK